jgi:pantothenate kinase
MAKSVHITLSDEATAELESLKKKLNLPSIAEVIRSSISVNKFLKMEEENGNEIVLRNKETKNERVVIMLK